MVKTLKDIEYESEIEYGYKVDVDTVVLRQLAREWIKDLEKTKFPGEYYLVKSDPDSDDYNPENDVYLDEEYETSDIRGAIKWIKYFFNLED